MHRRLGCRLPWSSLVPRGTFGTYLFARTFVPELFPFLFPNADPVSTHPVLYLPRLLLPLSGDWYFPSAPQISSPLLFAVRSRITVRRRTRGRRNRKLKYWDKNISPETLSLKYIVSLCKVTLIYSQIETEFPFRNIFWKKELTDSRSHAV